MVELLPVKYKLIVLANGNVTAKKGVRADSNFTRIHGKQVFYDVRTYAYQKGRTRFVFVDTDNRQLDFLGAPFPYTKEELENLMADKLMVTAVSAANGNRYGLMTVALAAVAGGGIGAFIGLIL